MVVMAVGPGAARRVSPPRRAINEGQGAAGHQDSSYQIDPVRGRGEGRKRKRGLVPEIGERGAAGSRAENPDWVAESGGPLGMEESAGSLPPRPRLEQAGACGGCRQGEGRDAQEGEGPLRSPQLKPGFVATRFGRNLPWSRARQRRNLVLEREKQAEQEGGEGLPKIQSGSELGLEICSRLPLLWATAPSKR